MTSTREPAPRDPCEIEDEVERMLAMGKEIRAHMTGPISSDLSDLFDENGFPSDRDDPPRTDLETALKA